MILIKANNENLKITCSLTYLCFLVAACVTLLSNLPWPWRTIPCPSCLHSIPTRWHMEAPWMQSPLSFHSAAGVIPKKLFLVSLTLSKAISCNHGLKSAVSESGSSWNLIPCVFSWIISSNSLLWAFPPAFYVPLKGWLCQCWVGRTFSALLTEFPFPWEHSQLAEVRCEHLKPHRLLPHLFPHFLFSIWWFLPSKCTFWTVSPTFNSGCIFQSASSLSKVNISQFQADIFIPFVVFQWKHWINPKLFH